MVDVKGDRVAIMLPNMLQYPIAVFGALRAGLIIVNVNPLYTVPEFIHQINNSGAETILVANEPGGSAGDFATFRNGRLVAFGVRDETGKEPWRYDLR